MRLVPAAFHSVGFTLIWVGVMSILSWAFGCMDAKEVAYTSYGYFWGALVSNFGGFESQAIDKEPQR